VYWNHNISFRLKFCGEWGAAELRLKTYVRRLSLRISLRWILFANMWAKVFRWRNIPFSVIKFDHQTGFVR
jgi:hypothetical protein